MSTSDTRHVKLVVETNSIVKDRVKTNIHLSDMPILPGQSDSGGVLGTLHDRSRTLQRVIKKYIGWRAGMFMTVPLRLPGLAPWVQVLEARCSGEGISVLRLG